MNQLKNIEISVTVDNNSKKKTDKTIIRKWCELHINDHHKFILLDSFNHCYYIYEKKNIAFKPHHFNGDEFFNTNKFINDNNSDIIFNNGLFKIILMDEQLKLKQRKTINNNIIKSIKKKKPIYIEF